MPVTDPFQVPDQVRAGPRRLNTKACSKAQAFEPHPAHEWEKVAGWPLACEGIPEVDQQPPCDWIDEGESKPCGAPAPAMVRTRTAIVDARVSLCIPHKRKHDGLAANRRSNKPGSKAS